MSIILNRSRDSYTTEFGIPFLVLLCRIALKKIRFDNLNTFQALKSCPIIELPSAFIKTELI